MGMKSLTNVKIFKYGLADNRCLDITIKAMIYACNLNRFVGKPVFHFDNENPYNNNEEPIGMISAITVNQDLLSDNYLYGDVILWDDKFGSKCDVNEFANYGISGIESDMVDDIMIVRDFKLDWISMR
jgi:hypothetical protein